MFLRPPESLSIDLPVVVAAVAPVGMWARRGVSTPVEDSAKGRRKRLPPGLVVLPWRETGSRRRGARVFSVGAGSGAMQSSSGPRPPAGRRAAWFIGLGLVSPPGPQGRVAGRGRATACRSSAIGTVSAGAALAEAVAVAVHLEDIDVMGKTVEQCPVRRSVPKVSVYSSKGRLEVMSVAPRS